MSSKPASHHYNNNSKLVLEKHHSKWIYYIGCLSGINSMIGILNGYYDTGLMVFAAFTTCLNYWRHPILGFRRNLDITVTSLSVTYNTYIASYCDNSHLYQMIAMTAIVLYCIGGMFYNYNYVGFSTFLHCMAHLGALTCSYLLFTHNICI